MERRPEMAQARAQVQVERERQPQAGALPAHDEAKSQGRLRTRDDLVEAIIHGAVKRVRPKAMTVCAAGMGLLPIMWATGTGGDLMKRIAAPMVGGLSTSFTMELLVYPAIYCL
jgi:Cu(I)/Ag(I) efflux system membrane protein CusA/SilA